MIVVDASVAVKWLLKEPGSAAALEVLGSDEQVLAPSLVQVEVAGAVTRKASRGELAQAEAERAFALWGRLLSSDRLQLEPDAIELPAAFAMSIQLSHPLQDCLYLAVANRRAVDLLTADRSFVQKARSAHANLRLLS